MKYIIGNWKANKSRVEVDEWFRTFADLFEKNKSVKLDNLEVVVCPPFIYLEQSANLCKKYKLPMKLGVQNVSPFANGPFTGEVTASQVAQFAQYVLIGHSERRSNFNEKDNILAKKVEAAKKANLQPIYCVPDENTSIPTGVSLVAYEPVWAIGGGQTDTPENASRVAASIKAKQQVRIIIYGGSVKPENVASFLETHNLDGVLPGGASLDPTQFWQIIFNAASI